MTSLVDRLRAAIDETERIAQAALAGPWRYNPAKQWHAPADLAERRNGEEYVAAGPHHAPVCVAVTGPAENEQSMADARHIAHHDPLRVLRRCAADRDIVEWCDEVIGGRDMSHYGEFGALADHPDAKAVTLAMETLLGLARGYGVEV